MLVKSPSPSDARNTSVLKNNHDFTNNLRNPFLRTYLRYVEHTAAPRIMHIWAALTTASACLGRHAYFDFGTGPIYPNLYTLLVGPPATKKSTAISLATKLTDKTQVKYAPNDTAGKRQGLIVALENVEPPTEKGKLFKELSGDDILSTLNSIDVTFSSPSKYAMFIKASEWGSFIGQNNIDLARFLIKLYDGEDYDYFLKKEKYIIRNPLFAMLGGTTPTDISVLLPPEVVGQGFMSRIILVHASKGRRAFRPKLDEKAANSIRGTFHHLWYNSHGVMTESPAAFQAFEKLYDYNVRINDTRFVYYAERRQTHLTKLAMILAACRHSMIIEDYDVNEAHYILAETEVTMSDALGEYGLLPEAKARQRLLEHLRYINLAIPEVELQRYMAKDMRPADFARAMEDMIVAGRVKRFNTPDRVTMVVYREPRRDAIFEAFTQEQRNDTT